MRASPAFQITVQRCGAWRVVVGALMLLSAAALAAWWTSDHGSVSLLIAIPLALFSLVGLAGGAGLLRCPATRLRWDRRCWHLASAAGAGDVGSPGRLAVAMDLGGWMLLKFEHDLPSRRLTTWLPVQRRGLEAQWHALRCAVYCARSAPGHDDGSNSAISPESQE